MMERQDPTQASQAQAQAQEEAAVQRALELLEAGELPGPGEADHALVAEYLASWTALPLLLEPAAPRPETKEALLRAISQSPTTAPVVPLRGPRPASQSTARGPSKAYWALAATLAAAVLGLSLFSWNLSQRSVILSQRSLTLSQQVLDLGQKVQEQEAAIATLLAPAPLAHMEAELTAADFTYRDLPAPAFEAVTVRQSQYFQVASAEKKAADSPRIDGAMLVCSKHRRWVLHIQGLQPLQKDQQYHLWFVTDQGTVHVGRVDLAADRTAQASSDRLPTKVIGLLVSQEGADSVGPRPTGPILARASQPVEI